VVILKYSTIYGNATVTGSPVYTETSGSRIFVFNSSGSFLIPQ
jgi:hypothetical protein